MTDEDSQERAIAANRGRQCARLERVSSVPGEQTEASASAGVSVEDCERCGDGWFCADHAPEPLILTSILELARTRPDVYVFAPDELLAERGRFARWYADGAEDEPRDRGRPVEGATEHEEIVAALVGYTATVRCIIGRDGVIRPKKSSWKAYQAGLGGSAEGLNTEALAAYFGVTPRTVTNWRAKISDKSLISREADLRPATTADLEAHTEAIRAHIDARVGEVLAVVLEAFPDNPPAIIENSINQLVDAVLSDANVDVDAD